MIQEIKDHQKRKFSDEVLQKKIKDSGTTANIIYLNS
jgi:hypothetical protein